MYYTQLFEWLYASHHSRQYIFTGFLDIQLSYWIDTWRFSQIEMWRSILDSKAVIHSQATVRIERLEIKGRNLNERQLPTFHKFKDILRKHPLRFNKTSLMHNLFLTCVKYVGLNEGYSFWLVLFKRLSNKHPSQDIEMKTGACTDREKLLWKSHFFTI